MADTNPKTSGRIATASMGTRSVKEPDRKLPPTRQLNNLMWQMTKFREDWERTANAFYRDHPDFCSHLARCAGANGSALLQLAEAFQMSDGCADKADDLPDAE